MTFRQRLQQLATQIDALSLRERTLLMLGAFMILFLAWDWMLMSDISTRSRAVNARIDSARSGIDRLNSAIAMAARSRSEDPNETLQRRLETTRTRIVPLDAMLAERAAHVIPPEQMASVLEDMLRRQGRLKLRGMKSLPPEALFRTEDADAVLPGSVYRHGLELEVEGRYLDVLAYLRELESLEWQFFWETVELRAEAYPANRVRIRVYSLNLEEGWLGV